MFGKLYKNVGVSLKTIAKIEFILISILAIFGGLFLLLKSELLGGLLLIVLFPIWAWLISLPIYGFGLIVESAEINIRNTSSKQSSQVQEKKLENIPIHTPLEKEPLQIDERQSLSLSCPYCRQKNAYTLKQLKSENIICPHCRETYFFDYKQYLKDTLYSG